MRRRICYALIWMMLYTVPVVHAQDITALKMHKQRLYRQYTRLAASAQDTTMDARYYHLSLRIRFRPNLLEGEVEALFQSRVDNLNTIVLDLDDAMNVTAVGASAGAFQHNNQKLRLTLKKTYHRNDTLRVRVRYRGLPANDGGDWFVFDTIEDSLDHVWTLSEPYGARYWWPCKDTPADKADSVDIRVTVPAGLWVASNGLLADSVLTDSTNTFFWKERYPIAPYLVSLAVAPYARFRDSYPLPGGDVLPLYFYVYPSEEARAREVFKETRDHLDVLSAYFGPYPFAKEKYGLARFGWGGGMEHQTLTSVGRVSEAWRFLYVHELGHQWFGDALTCASWRDIWLNEGFASYSEALYAEARGYGELPPGRAAYDAYMSSQLYYGDETVYREDTTSVAGLFDRVVYDKGSWILHMLRGQLGDTLFFKGLRRYARDSTLLYTSVRTADVRSAFEEVSGRALKTFFDQWLLYPFYPSYEVGWQTSTSDSGSVLTVTIRQEQPRPVYQLNLELKAYYSNGADTVLTLFNDSRDQTYRFVLSHAPVNLRLDPGNKVLKNVRYRNEAAYTPRITIDSARPNPFREQIEIRVTSWRNVPPELTVFDVSGRRLRRLKARVAGAFHDYYYAWDGRTDTGRRVAAGIYFIADAEGKAAARVLYLK